jgi:hypothetical protein
MADKIVDLGQCRTGYIDDTFSHTLGYITDVTPPNTETVVFSEIISNLDDDSGTTLIDNGNHSYTYSGNYTIDSFPLVIMKFRDFDTLNDITITGWPPSDDRVKDMHEFNLDPRDARTYEIVIRYKLTGTDGTLPKTTSPYNYDPELGLYIRVVDYKYLKDAVNKTGEQFAVELSSYFN